MILLFTISFLILVTFLSWKSWEEYKGKRLIPIEFLEISDDWIKMKLSELIVFLYRKYKKLASFSKGHHEKISRKFFVLWYKFMEEVGLGFLRFRDAIKGRYIKKGRGHASGFLKDISEYKKSLSKE